MLDVNPALEMVALIHQATFANCMPVASGTVLTKSIHVGE